MKLHEFKASHLRWREALRNLTMARQIVDALSVQEARAAARNDHAFSRLSAKDKLAARRWCKTSV